ncbi:MAG: PadR family transcriptional regulator [Clostridiales bacterium]|nr:PadR family transcriptional regulator [Clostridiales bacterium]
MDVQLKRGVLDCCVLAVLNRGDSYGYQIVKDLSAVIGISESTLYPILKRLETGGFLTVYAVEHNSRLRKYYKITPQGKQRCEDFLLEFQEITTVYDFIREEMGKEDVKA